MTEVAIRGFSGKENVGMPKNAPQPGFYYHYKHNPNGPVNAHAYEVVNIGWHMGEGVWMVMYLPLYEWAPVYRAGKHFYLRPLHKWLEKVEIECGWPTFVECPKWIPRYTKIEDEKIIEQLQKIKQNMYGEE